MSRCTETGKESLVFFFFYHYYHYSRAASLLGRARSHLNFPTTGGGDGGGSNRSTTAGGRGTSVSQFFSHHRQQCAHFQSYARISITWTRFTCRSPVYTHVTSCTMSVLLLTYYYCTPDRQSRRDSSALQWDVCKTRVKSMLPISVCDGGVAKLF